MGGCLFAIANILLSIPELLIDLFWAWKDRHVAPPPPIVYPLHNCTEEDREHCAVVGDCLYRCWQLDEP